MKLIEKNWIYVFAIFAILACIFGGCKKHTSDTPPIDINYRIDTIENHIYIIGTWYAGFIIHAEHCPNIIHKCN